MKTPPIVSPDGFNIKIIEEFRANGGRVGGPWADTTIILIHHIGAKSGIERVSPLGCSPQGDGRFAIVASSGGIASDATTSTRNAPGKGDKTR